MPETPAEPHVAVDYAAPRAINPDRLFAKITLMLVPFLFVLYVVGYLDRVNIGSASLTMPKDLGLNETAYGFAAGIFFLGYFLLGLPSNLVLQRVGARRWIAGIMIFWGGIASAMMFVKGAASLSVMRFLLGAAEAGFFPGIVLYLTYWFPQERRARAMSCSFVATAIAGVIGNPMSAACLKMNGIAGLRGWQWLFLLEGLPSVVLGLLVLFVLPDSPRHARWLLPNERDWLLDHLRQGQSPPQSRSSLAGALRDRRVWLLSAIYFLLMAGLYTFSFFAPKVLKATAPKSWSDSWIVLLAAIPSAVAAVSMVLVARHSDATGERNWHLAASALVGGVGIAGTALSHEPILCLITLSVGAAGIWSMFGIFWTVPTGFLRGTAAAGGIAIINSLGCLNGWLAPTVVGKLSDLTHHYTGGLLVVAGSLLGSGLLACLLPNDAAKVGC